jgi:signal transduction histidine kinase
MLLVISLSLVLEWLAVWRWSALLTADPLLGGSYLLGIWSFAFVPALIGAAGLVPFYPANESWLWRATVALVFSLGAGALRFGVEFAVWGAAFLAGPVFLEGLLSVMVPFSCITVSMYLAKSQIRSVKAERLVTEMEFQARQSALEHENAELRVRREMSAVLHDQIQQRLVFAAARLQGEIIPMARANDDRVAIELLEEIIGDIDRLREDDVRQLSHSLFPVGADMGLHQAVALAIGRVPASVSVRVDTSDRAAAFDTVTEPTLDIAARATLVSVLDEAITNALKHGAAKAIEVSLDLEGDGADRRLVMRVSNDGKPLPEGVGPSGGLARHRQHFEARGGSIALGSSAAGKPELVASWPVPDAVATPSPAGSAKGAAGLGSARGRSRPSQASPPDSAD